MIKTVRAGGVLAFLVLILAVVLFIAALPIILAVAIIIIAIGGIAFLMSSLFGKKQKRKKENVIDVKYRIKD
ncbi:hypothetical protein JXB11_04295 [Candidatus Woesearchaeota archaeon]|nr:hypothetical protein [Candidatus Woesearchaeota archaeon]